MLVMRIRSQGQEDPLEEEMAAHSSILVCKISWTESPAGYSPWGHRVQHDLANKQVHQILGRHYGRSTPLSELTGPGPQDHTAGMWCGCFPSLSGLPLKPLHLSVCTAVVFKRLRGGSFAPQETVGNA